MFKKKKLEFVPDGDPYADDPFVYKTRRGLSAETLERNWKIRVAKGGDVKAHMSREFSPWFLEKEKAKNIEDDMTVSFFVFSTFVIHHCQQQRR